MIIMIMMMIVDGMMKDGDVIMMIMIMTSMSM